MPESVCWTADELRQELAKFEAEARRAGLRESTVRTYVDRSALFLRWLERDYSFSGPQGA